MANEVMIKIKVKDETDYEPALAKAREFGEKVKEALNESGTVNIKVDDEDAKVKIKEFEEELHKLNGDDATVKIKVKEEDVKEEVVKVKDELKSGLKDDGGAGTSWAQSFVGKIKNFDFKPSLVSVGIAVGAAFAPLLGASIAGLIVGGLGLGGIVGGVMLAARDPRVKTAFDDIKHDLGDSLKLDAAPFVPVVVDGLNQVSRQIKALDLGTVFKDLAPQVQPVLSGLLDLVGSLGASLRNAVANSGPVLKELGDDFRNLGRTLQSAFDSLDDNSKQEAQALHDLFAIVDGGITLIFALVNALTEVYDVWHKIFELSPEGLFERMQDGSQKVTGAVDDQVQAVIAAVNANKDLAGSSDKASEAAKAQAAEIQKVSDALKAQTDPAFALIDAQKQVNDATDAYNKAVRKSGEGSKAAKAAQVDLDKAMVNYVSSAAKASGGTGHLTDEQKALLKAAGASNKTIKDLDTQLNNAYKSAHKLDNFNIDITITEHFKQTGKYISQSQIDNPTQLYSGLAHGGIGGAANGSTSGGLTWVGEHGPELMNLPPGTAVHTAGDSQRLAAGAGMDAAGGPMIVQLHLDGHVIAAAMVDPQRKFVQQNFGGNVQKAYGVGV